jgi:predicted DNA-binding ribbon-helix-helix protein
MSKLLSESIAPQVARQKERPAPQSERGLRSGNIVVNGHRTSMRLEPEMWSALSEIARAEGMGMNELVSTIATSGGRNGSLTSAVRVFIMGYFRAKANA